MVAPDDIALAQAIAAERGAGDVRVLAEGSNNTVFVATGRWRKIAIKLSKPHREDGAQDEYRKEAWCVSEARRRGVRVPEVYDFGVRDGRAYEVMAFVDGAAPPPASELSAWRALGDVARRIHGIPVEGWGGRMIQPGWFSESWNSHLTYNIVSLGDDDVLRTMDVLTPQSSARLHAALERIGRKQFNFGLCHGDIALWNTLIDSSGDTWLLDWGCAVAHVVPHYEINEILRGSQPSEEALRAFLEGYGISVEAYAAMERDLRALAALREIDTLRWAIDKKPDEIDRLAPRARAAVAALR